MEKKQQLKFSKRIHGIWKPTKGLVLQSTAILFCCQKFIQCTLSVSFVFEETYSVKNPHIAAEAAFYTSIPRTTTIETTCSSLPHERLILECEQKKKIPMANVVVQCIIELNSLEQFYVWRALISKRASEVVKEVKLMGQAYCILIHQYLDNCSSGPNTNCLESVVHTRKQTPH